MLVASDTIVAIATSPGRGAVGVIRVSGAAVPAVIAGIVGRDLAPREACLATFRGSRSEALDRGLALYFPAPHSYTGEAVLELHGHGGPAVLRLLLVRCVELGARLAEPGEFTKRAFLNGKLDLVEAEGVADLIEAATASAARAAARSLCGEFSREVKAVVAAVTELRMYVEAALDFPDEDIDFVRTHDAAGKLSAMRGQLAELTGRARAGARLREGLTAVLVGRPNVGKSSLLNRLVREDAAIVTPIPGTTRDTVERTVEIAGLPLTVIDTAGLRDTDDALEQLGIERTWAAIGQADLALVIVDARQPADALASEDRALLDRLPASLPRLVVHNKADLAGEAPRVERRDAEGGPQRHVWLSALTGAGVDRLVAEVLALAGADAATEDVFLARERHLMALGEAATHLAEASVHLELTAPPLELFAEELREAQGALGEITGEFTPDDLLGVIFSRFCIGK